MVSPRSAADGVQIVIGAAQLQILKEDFVQLRIIILPRMYNYMMEITVSAAYHGGQADDFRTRAQNGHQFKLAHTISSPNGLFMKIQAVGIRAVRIKHLAGPHQGYQILVAIIRRMYAKGFSGPLWEYLAR